MSDDGCDQCGQRDGHWHGCIGAADDALRRACDTIEAMRAALADAADLATKYAEAIRDEFGHTAAGDISELEAAAERFRAMAAPGWQAPIAEDAAKAKVPVHADGGDCHGRAIIDGICSGCGIAPDMQSIELWPPSEVK